MRHHTIAPRRDRFQSRMLLAGASPVFLWLVFHATRYALTLDRTYAVRVLAISLTFALAAWRLRAATPLAAILGGAVCLTCSLFTSTAQTVSPFATGLTPLLLLFILTFAATRLGRSRKAAAGLAESRRGRSAAQVLANLGISAVAASFAADRIAQLTAVPMLAALVEATADTVSSEIGQAFGGKPRMLLTFRPVPVGTDGAITTTGTLAGTAAGALIAAASLACLRLTILQAGTALAAGIAGLFFDSLLGASVERHGWLGNDLVNLTSTTFSAAVACFLVRISNS